MWDVVGQDRATSLFQRSLEAGSLSHAYLLVGPAHVGKMTLAMNLAQAVNCEGTAPPCRECAACQRIASGKHADVQVVELGNAGDGSADSEARVKISVDQIEQVQHSANLPPFEGRCKVFIFDGAELLSIGAANRLLKTLEEPADKVLFVLLTTNQGLLPATIVSRCQRVEVVLLGVAAIEKALTSRWGVEPDRAGLVARLANGRIGWAVAAASDDGLLAQYAEELDGLLEVTAAGNESRFAFAGRLATGFGRDRGSVLDRLGLWRDWWRDLMLVKVGCEEAVVNLDRIAILRGTAGEYTLAQIRAFIENIRAAGEQLKLNANPLLALEVLMLSIPDRSGEKTVAPGPRQR